MSSVGRIGISVKHAYRKHVDERIIHIEFDDYCARVIAHPTFGIQASESAHLSYFRYNSHSKMLFINKVIRVKV